MKSEPEVFSIADLKQRGASGEPWDGVRNYQARNYLRDDFQPGDGVLFYHSNCQPPGIVGLAEVVSGAFPDTSAFDPQSPYFDPRSDPARPRWFSVQVRYVETFPQPITLAELKADPALADLPVVRPGNRLSVHPVTPEHFRYLAELGRRGRSAD